LIQEQIKEGIAHNSTKTHHNMGNLIQNENSNIYSNTNFQQELYPSAQPLYNSHILSSNGISYIPPPTNTLQPLYISPSSNQPLYNPYIHQPLTYSSNPLPVDLQSQESLNMLNSPFFSPTFSSINSFSNNNSQNLPNF
jgi:hypothetical protein